MISTNQSEKLSQEQSFIDWLNRNIPQGVDWKQGALDYIAARLGEDNGEVVRRAHLIKPFYSVYGDIPINQQLNNFTREMTHFLNVLAMLSVSSETRFLDVACGSGWWTHFLSKLNLQVVGTDISSDMIDLTRERLSLDRIPTQESDNFDRVTLLIHDMEESALPQELKCDVAVLESALHHFVNPIETLRNIANSLSDDGVIVILEGASDGQGDRYYTEVMRQYNTLERPYTREQLVAILQFAELAEYQFFFPINGFFPHVPGISNSVQQQILYADYWNIVFVAKRPGALKKYLKFEGSAFMQPSAIQSIKETIPDSDLMSHTEQEVIANHAVLPMYSEPWGDLGVKGELRILSELLTSSSKRIVRKTIAKLTRK